VDPFGQAQTDKLPSEFPFGAGKIKRAKLIAFQPDDAD
jgi:hypothetical protein